MTLTDDDRAILQREGCIVDAEAAAKEVWLTECRRVKLAQGLFPGDMPGWDDDLYHLPEAESERERFRDYAHAALRAAGLEPGEPAVHLILAAMERRGWTAELDYRQPGHTSRGEWCGEVWWWSGGRVTSRCAYHADPATALALAFVAAVRASEGAAE